MQESQSFIHRQKTLNIFSQLFPLGFPAQGHSAYLKDIVHWQTQVRELNLYDAPLNENKTLFCGGFIYNFSSILPDKKEIEQLVSSDVEQIIIPMMRSTDKSHESYLTERGFIKVPATIECLFEIENSIEDDLLKRIKNRRYREIFKFKEKAEELYTIDFYSGSEIKKSRALIKIISDLHNRNIIKYNYPSNFYNEEVISFLCNSDIADNLQVALRKTKSDDQPVQVVINFISPETKELFLLVIGSNRKLIPKGQNLYIDALYALYKFGEQHSCETIHIGRGSALNKFTLGANKFYLLNHWLWSKDKSKRKFLEDMAIKSRKALNLDKYPFEIIT